MLRASWRSSPPLPPRSSSSWHLAGADELHLDASGAHHRRPEGLEDRDLRAELAPQRLGQRDAAAHDHDVDVGRGAPQVVVADVAADDEGADALGVGQARNAAEYRIRERHGLLDVGFQHVAPHQVALAHEVHAVVRIAFVEQPFAVGQGAPDVDVRHALLFAQGLQEFVRRHDAVGVRVMVPVGVEIPPVHREDALHEDPRPARIGLEPVDDPGDVGDDLPGGGSARQVVDADHQEQPLLPPHYRQRRTHPYSCPKSNRSSMRTARTECADLCLLYPLQVVLRSLVWGL